MRALPGRRRKEASGTGQSTRPYYSQSAITLPQWQRRRKFADVGDGDKNADDDSSGAESESEDEVAVGAKKMCSHLVTWLCQGNKSIRLELHLNPLKWLARQLGTQTVPSFRSCKSSGILLHRLRTAMHHRP